MRFQIAYFKKLGTPFQVGDKIATQDGNEQVVGYDWDFEKGLIIVTNKHRYADYDIANEYRRMKIDKFRNKCLSGYIS